MEEQCMHREAEEAGGVVGWNVWEAGKGILQDG